jgi:hypothetical protein
MYQLSRMWVDCANDLMQMGNGEGKVPGKGQEQGKKFGKKYVSHNHLPTL